MLHLKNQALINTFRNNTTSAGELTALQTHRQVLNLFQRSVASTRSEIYHKVIEHINQHPIKEIESLALGRFSIATNSRGYAHLERYLTEIKSAILEDDITNLAADYRTPEMGLLIHLAHEHLLKCSGDLTVQERTTIDIVFQTKKFQLFMPVTEVGGANHASGLLGALEQSVADSAFSRFQPQLGISTGRFPEIEHSTKLPLNYFAASSYAVSSYAESVQDRVVQDTASFVEEQKNNSIAEC